MKRKLIKRIGAFALMAFSGLFLLSPNDVEATEGGGQFVYKYVAYFAREGNCVFVVNECTKDKGDSCTISGTKSRGFPYCFAIPASIIPSIIEG